MVAGKSTGTETTMNKTTTNNGLGELRVILFAVDLFYGIVG